MAPPTSRGSQSLERDEITAAVRAERLRLCDFLTDLTERDWAVPSLCAGWTVREVVAHLTVTTRATIPFVLKAAIRARGDFDRMTTDLARDRSARFTPAELVQQLRESAESSRRMPASGPMDPLMDLVVHGLDIARPLDRPFRVREEVAVPVLAYVAASRFLGGPQRFDGVRLVEADGSWSSGEGLEVRGPVDDLILVATGRPAGLAQLSGPGVARLSERLTVH